MDSSLVSPGKKGQDDKMIANLSSTAFKIMNTMAFHTTQPFMLLTLHGIGRCTSNYSNRLATQLPMKSSSVKKQHLIHSHSMYQNQKSSRSHFEGAYLSSPFPPPRKKKKHKKWNKQNQRTVGRRPFLVEWFFHCSAGKSPDLGTFQTSAEV